MRNGDEGWVTRKQCPASVMVWATVTESGKSLLFCWSRGEIEPAELSRWHPCWCIVALGTRALEKTSLVFSAELCTITWGLKDSGVAFRECFALHYQREMGQVKAKFGQVKIYHSCSFSSVLEFSTKYYINIIHDNAVMLWAEVTLLLFDYFITYSYGNINLIQ